MLHLILSTQFFNCWKKFLLILLLLPAMLSAHTFWMEPAAYQVKPDSVLRFHLRIGHLGTNETPETFSYSSKHAKRFWAANSQNSKPIVGVDGMDPAGVIRWSQPGIVLVGYLSKDNLSSLSPKRFYQYLKEEGLDKALTPKQRKMIQGQWNKELFCRCAKSMVKVGNPPPKEQDYHYSLGLPLEIIPLNNPYALSAKEKELTLEVRFQGKALPGVLVRLAAREKSHKLYKKRTNSKGQVTFSIKEGIWLAHCVHLVSLPNDSRAQWKSYWASLSFAAGKSKAKK